MTKYANPRFPCYSSSFGMINGKGMPKGAHHRRIWLVLVLFTACANHDTSVISLLDQIEKAAPAGAWTTMALLPGGQEVLDHASGLHMDDKIAVQRGDSSTIRIARKIGGNSLILVAIAYAGPVSPADTVAVSFATDQGIQRATARALGPRILVLPVRAPPGGAGGLLIEHFVKPGETVGIRSVASLCLEASAKKAMRTRAMALLRLRLSGHPSTSWDALRFQVSSIEIGRCRRDGVFLVSTDTLDIDVPRIPSGVRLVFWSSPLTEDSRSKLTIAVSRGGEWRALETLSLSGAEPRMWTRHELALSLPTDQCRLRFLLSRGGVTAIAEPVLIPDTSNRSSRFNVIIIDLDTARADRFGCYGYGERPTSAALDSFLDSKGFHIFRNAYSAASWTLPSTAKFFTSRYWDIQEPNALPRRHTTIAELLRTAGFYCAAFTGGVVMRSAGLEQGFHEYWFTEAVGKAEDTFPPAMAWLRANMTRPFLLFLQTYEAHVPYTRDVFCRSLPNGKLGDLSSGKALLPPEFDKWTALPPAESLYVQAAYDGGIRYACDATARLFSLMDSLDLWQNTVVVVLSDHGEEFWDHFTVFAEHGHSLYNDQVNIPFMIYAPNFSNKGAAHLDEPVSSVDLLPTLLDLLRINTSYRCDGVSVGPAMTSGPLARRLPIFAMTRRMREGSLFRAAVYQGRAKYVETMVDSSMLPDRSPLLRFITSPEELFDLTQDSNERVNLVEGKPELALHLSHLLRQGIHETAEPVCGGTSEHLPAEMPKSLRKQLEALGYIELP